MKSDTDIVVENSRKIEQLLREKLNAKGNGLVEQLKSTDRAKVSYTLDYVIRKIAHARNGVVHRGTKLNNKSDFKKMVDAAIADLSALPSIKKNNNAKKKIVQRTTPPPKAAMKKKPVAKEPVVYPPDFDPYVVDLKYMGTYGSDRYKKA
jgi:hypothetical protein